MKRPDTTEYYPSEAGKEWQAYAEWLEGEMMEDSDVGRAFAYSVFPKLHGSFTEVLKQREEAYAKIKELEKEINRLTIKLNDGIL